MNIISTDSPAALQLSGRFDAHEAAAFRAELEQLFDRTESDVAVVLTDVSFVDSAALAELVRGMKRARTDQRELILEAPSDAVRVILELTKLDAAFTVR